MAITEVAKSKTRVVDGVTFYWCNKCRRFLPSDSFGVNNFSKRGLNYACLECMRRYIKGVRDKNREWWLQYSRRYYQEHKEARKEAKDKYNQKLKDGVYEAYGGYKCVCCGETEPAFLTIDHINGCGRKLRKEQGFGNHFLFWLREHNYPEGFQILCWNCNLGKHFNGGICPHVTQRKSKDS